MEEQNKEVSILRKDLNLFFVYGVIFLAGIAVVSIMLNIINSKVNEINEGMYQPQQYNNNM